MLVPLVIVCLGAACARAVTRDLERAEIRYAMLAYAFHVVASFAQVAFHDARLAQGGDVDGYLELGRGLARLLDTDFPRFAPEVVKLILHYENELPIEIYGSGSSTGTMCGIAGFYVFVLGPSLLSVCLTTGVFAWFGQLCLYRVARAELPNDRSAAIAGCLFVPSLVFWTSLFAKEAFAMTAFGVLALSTYRLLSAGRLVFGIGIVLGAAGVGLLKPYILLPYLVAVVAWVYADRALKGHRFRIRPLSLILAACVAWGGVALMGNIFPQFEMGRLPEAVAVAQGTWAAGEGSDIGIGSAEARTVSEQLPFAPMALVNALFRPVIFEARNPPMFGAAMETAAIAVGMIMLVRRLSWRRFKEAIAGSPPLVFSFVFVALFATAVGLTTSNLGSLSRYRVPMMPFYVTALLVLRRRASVSTGLRTSVVSAGAKGTRRAKTLPLGPDRVDPVRR